MDLESRSRWVEYSRAKDEMFAHTDIKQGSWYGLNADNKKCARLNVIRHILGLISYKTDATTKQAATAGQQKPRPPPMGARISFSSATGKDTAKFLCLSAPGQWRLCGWFPRSSCELAQFCVGFGEGDSLPCCGGPQVKSA